jgi:hypothetical protein
MRRFQVIEKEWENEPDHLDVQHDDFHFVILRHPELLHLNGYIGVPIGHPLFGKGDDEVDIDCHWSFTFTGNGLPHMRDNYWYFGFDCAHAGDLVPKLYEMGFYTGEVYRNIQYVVNELSYIAEQIQKQFSQK